MREKLKSQIYKPSLVLYISYKIAVQMHFLRLLLTLQFLI